MGCEPQKRILLQDKDKEKSDAMQCFHRAISIYKNKMYFLNGELNEIQWRLMWFSPKDKETWEQSLSKLELILI